ncbi:MAG: cytochrome c biogenesis CcdA family protein [Acidimicrobiia bacterium]|nr:cytochrome c biogenesis CcdA family protein [Acidimicrobiia bacterium]
MIEAPFALAFAAGMVAMINPCGFAMLPAYLSYFMGLDQGPPRGRTQTVGSALLVGGTVAAGFLLVFGTAGFLITAGFRSVIDWIPWLALVVGVAVLILGVAMLRGFDLNVALPKAKRGRRDRNVRSVFLFGVSYAVASLSCTLPVFLTVVAGQVTQSSLLSGLVTFLVYGLGMALVLLAITVALAVGKTAIVGRFRTAMRHVNTVSGVILVLAGSYIVWFWGTTLTSGATSLDNGVFRAVESLSQSALNGVSNNTATVGWTLAAVVTAAAVTLFVGRLRGKSKSAEPVDDLTSV